MHGFYIGRTVANTHWSIGTFGTIVGEGDQPGTWMVDRHDTRKLVYWRERDLVPANTPYPVPRPLFYSPERSLEDQVWPAEEILAREG